MFEVLLYTDCTAEDSVSGRAGFQFHAESEGVKAADEQQVQQRLLYVIPGALPVDDPSLHPESFAYTRTDQGYYLARGRSTGNTRSGRPGNQLTQAVVTRDPLDILPFRPAQFFGAPNWSLELSPTRRLQPWSAPLEVDGRFTPEGLLAMVRQDPWLQDHLAVVFTMGELAVASHPVRLALIHRDIEVVMRWIALLTVFEDGVQALDTSFRVFTENPSSDPTPILGVHPDVTPDFGPGNAEGMSVVDIEGRVLTSLEPSASAIQHAHWFLTGDPYEALDAVMASRRWSRVMGRDLGVRAAALATRSSEARNPTTYPAVKDVCSALIRLSERNLLQELGAYGNELVDVIAGFAPQVSDDISPGVEALWALQAAGADGLACGLVPVLLEWASARCEAAARWAELHRGSSQLVADLKVRWRDDSDTTQAARLLVGILDECPDADLPMWFAIARSLALPLEERSLASSVDRLARRWALEPTLSDARHGWVMRDLATAAMSEHLASELDRGTQSAIDAMARGDWRWLGADLSVGIADSLDAWGFLCRVRDPSDPEREALLARAAPALPYWAAIHFVPRRADLRSYARDAAVWLRAHPGQLSDDFGHELGSFVDQCSQAMARVAYDTVMLALQEPPPRPLPPTLSRWVVSDVSWRRAHDLAVELRDEDRNEGLRLLARASVDVLGLRGRETARAVLFSRDVTRARGVLAAADGAFDGVFKVLAGRRFRQGDVDAFAQCLLLEDGSPATSCVTVALDSFLTDSSAKVALKAIRDRLTDEESGLLRDRKTQPGSRLGRSIRRVTRMDRRGRRRG